MNFNLEKKGGDSSSFPKWYECDQPGHLRFDCPVFKRRMEKSDKKTFKDKKEKKAYITWEDNDMDSSSDSENEIVNLSLMAKD